MCRKQVVSAFHCFLSFSYNSDIYPRFFSDKGLGYGRGGHLQHPGSGAVTAFLDVEPKSWPLALQLLCSLHCMRQDSGVISKVLTGKNTLWSVDIAIENCHLQKIYPLKVLMLHSLLVYRRRGWDLRSQVT